VQSRLLLGIAVGSAIVLLSAGLVFYGLIRAALIAEFDASFTVEARTLAALVETEDGLIQSEMSERGMERFERKDRPEYYQLWRHDGTVIERSSRLSPRNLNCIAGPFDRPRLRFARLPDGRPGRTIGVTFTPHQEGQADRDPDHAARLSAKLAPLPVTLVVGRDTIDLDRTLARIKRLLLGVFGGAVLLSLLVTAPIVYLGLRPLRATSARIAVIDSQSLDLRLDSTDVPAEVRSVIDCLNGLLDRLDQAFQRERAFSANVAHELRTPLAGLRSTIEVTLSKPRDPTAYQHVLANCLEICKQTQWIVENLLLLARIDSGQCELRRTPVRLDELIHQAWAPLAERAESRGLNVTWITCNRTIVNTDREKLRMILHNLYDNAVTYADPGSTIEIAASSSEETAGISISNAGSSLSPQDVQHVFDRFWRGDRSRGETGQHAGLGLPLCKELARLLGAEVFATTENSSRFRVWVKLPRT